MKAIFLFPGLALAGLTAAATPNQPGDGSCSSETAKVERASWNGEKSILETAVGAGQFNTLAAALEAGGLIDALSGEGPFTVFAPTDDAFASLPEGTVASLLKPENLDKLQTILTYHVVAGAVPASEVVKLKNASSLNGERLPIEIEEGTVRVAGAQVVKTDIHCTNGIIHVIDSVMIPNTKNIVETAVDAGSFGTLAAALQAADLVEALQGEGPFTVFAPTDEAFAKLPEGTVESLLKPENKDKLIAILKYHVVSGRAYSDQLENGGVATLQGSKVHVKLSDEGVSINDSRVLMADIDTTNGVIHVVDTVLLPH